ncbi:hypothetical protein C5167_011114 [Papaver somniferum]|uniref:MLO-like protein n=1 Tax=Papaver somniferum TaxID=3469 RepID=A0A4Y7K251_PAPSO|nr:MLO-like protein 5 [Papaver somniferum]RZC67414.1 hypothetical protein C5167_011114 [Papaver somniferum]
MGEDMNRGATSHSRELDQTPTWAVAIVVAVIIVLSIILEKVLHRVGEWFTERKKLALYEALEKVKGELMVLGFISLLLTFGQNYIAKICVPLRIADTMLPCAYGGNHHDADTSHVPPLSPHSPDSGHGDGELEHGTGEHSPDSGHEAGESEHETGEHSPDSGHEAGESEHETGEHSPPTTDSGHEAGESEHETGEHSPPTTDSGHEAGESEHGPGDHHRRLLWDNRRVLSADSENFQCKDGFEPLISLHGLHQLHIFIFFLAIFHVIFSASTMMLGRLKIRAWKEWESEISSHDYEDSNDPARFRLTHETSFVKSHATFWTRTRFFFYVGSFLRQFFRSVRRADYHTMRNGFVTVHLAPGSKFNFQKYIKRSLEDDFKVVVGISPLLWASVVLYLLLNVSGWQAMFWVSVTPLFVILAVGTKLQAIITQMALEIQQRHAVVQGIPLVQVSDRHFWFAWPPLILYLIHFTLFQNAFQITYFLWIWYEFGLRSCFHQNFNLIILRVILGVLVQFMCSYITLPLYALVTQMGSTMKKSIFDEQTSKALKQWHKNAVHKKAEGGTGKKPKTPTRTLGGSPGGSPSSSPRRPSDPQSSSAATLIANVDHDQHEVELITQRGPTDLLSGP